MKINTMTKEAFEQVAVSGSRGDNVGLLKTILQTNDYKEIICDSPEQAKVKLSALSAVRRKHNFQLLIKAKGAKLYIGPGSFTANNYGPRKPKADAAKTAKATTVASKTASAASK